VGAVDKAVAVMSGPAVADIGQKAVQHFGSGATTYCSTGYKEGKQRRNRGKRKICLSTRSEQSK